MCRCVYVCALEADFLWKTQKFMANLQFWAGAQKMVHFWLPQITRSLLGYYLTHVKLVASHQLYSVFEMTKITNVQFISKKGASFFSCILLSLSSMNSHFPVFPWSHWEQNVPGYRICTLKMLLSDSLEKKRNVSVNPNSCSSTM